MIKEGVKTYNLWLENTILDKVAMKYYKDKGESSKINSRIKLKGDFHMASFGDFIIKFEISKKLSIELEKFTKKLRSLEI